MKNIVCIGAGTGQSNLLVGLLEQNHNYDYGNKITGIIGVTDNGGHSGRLKKEYNIPQVGDYRNCLENCLKYLYGSDSVSFIQYSQRFNGTYKGVALGNLILLGLINHYKKFEKVANHINSEYFTRFNLSLFPVSDDCVDVMGTYKNGNEIIGEWEIINSNEDSELENIKHFPISFANGSTIKAIREADLIIICPGTFYTGIISCLTFKGIREAIINSDAEICYIANMITQKGNMTSNLLSDYLFFLENVIGSKIDYAVINKNKLPDYLFKDEFYSSEKQIIVDEKCSAFNTNIIEYRHVSEETTLISDRNSGMYISGKHLVRHNPKELGRIIFDLIKGL